MVILGIDPGEKLHGYAAYDFKEKYLVEKGEVDTEKLMSVASSFNNVAMETWSVGNPKIHRHPMFQTIENIGYLKMAFKYTMIKQIYPERSEILKLMRISGNNHDSQVMHWIKAMYPGIKLSGHTWQAMAVAIYAYYQWGGR